MDPTEYDSPSPHQKMETDPVSKKYFLWYLEF
jgi:hypothetical protein